MEKRDIPNAICWGRIALIPFVLLFMIPSLITEALTYKTSVMIAGIIFAVAMISDFVDGKIARKYNYTTNLGKFLDPLADKALVLSVCIAVTSIEHFSSLVTWCTILILLRELLVTGLRLSAASKGSVVAANWWGKIKTALQGVTLVTTFVCLYLGEACDGIAYIYTIPEILFAITAVYTCISAIPYIKACAPYLKG
ncbi:MAG: CDP-diacylglycerol--glycerol-3-phosphate 3-phosphatidyltransferase [Clostridia bacterium]|nr:CDP-diacylglycerol--glycerol-3-phosphate 3-phosphatidyltransferase [Clostridia bacterium]